MNKGRRRALVTFRFISFATRAELHFPSLPTSLTYLLLRKPRITCKAQPSAMKL
jgi:hypothetical protein